MPSPSGYTRRARLRWRRVVSCASALRSIRRQPRTIISTCSAVPARPTASSRSSVSGVATLVSARTFEYDSSPRARACASRGSDPNARATRTCSRAAPGSSPTRQDSHAAHERKPLPQPPRASNARMRSSSRAVAASRCTASSAISSPRRSSSAVRAVFGSAMGLIATQKSLVIGASPCADSIPAFSTASGACRRRDHVAVPNFSAGGCLRTPPCHPTLQERCSESAGDTQPKRARNSVNQNLRRRPG
jgi:hypothetical protein